MQTPTLRRERINRSEPRDVNDCPPGTYFRPGQTRQVGNEQIYIRASCPKIFDEPIKNEAELSEEEADEAVAAEQEYQDYINSGMEDYRYMPSLGRNYFRNRPEPQSPDDCPPGYYFRPSQTRQFLGEQTYLKASCAPLPSPPLLYGRGTNAGQGRYRSSPRR